MKCELCDRERTNDQMKGAKVCKRCYNGALNVIMADGCPVDEQDFDAREHCDLQRINYKNSDDWEMICSHEDDSTVCWETMFNPDGLPDYIESKKDKFVKNYFKNL